MQYGLIKAIRDALLISYCIIFYLEGYIFVVYYLEFFPTGGKDIRGYFGFHKRKDGNSLHFRASGCSQQIARHAQRPF